MTTERVLITGGAGFIGSHTADALLKRGFRVRILDNLHPQVHGPTREPPTYLSADIELVVGDVRDREAMCAALDDVQYVYHMAAETGVGQSMYEVERYISTNVTGTAVLWDAIASKRDAVRKVLFSSSRAVYGEGKYRCSRDGFVYPTGRAAADLAQQMWSMKCPTCGEAVQSFPTDEASPLNPTSVYALTKKFQEEMCRLMASVHHVPVVALRYFNVYGTRQALSNPYTGVIATFCTRLLNGKPIALYEDGLPQRDFVHVEDVVQANLAALEFAGEALFNVFNVGTGIPLTLQAVGEQVCGAMGSPGQFETTARHRVGDILSCYADLTCSRDMLGYVPRVEFCEGIRDLVAWIGEQAPPDRSEEVTAELEAKGLMFDN